jgi:GT2 family glycosyltransferase
MAANNSTNMPRPEAAIVILNWNNAPDTIECLESVSRLDYPNYRVLVVDNGSTDGSVGLIRAAHPNVKIIETGENLGYAGGNNFGIRHVLRSGADFVFIVNNDVIVAPDCLSRLVTAAQHETLAGLIGPKVYHRERPDHIQSAGIVLDASFRSHHRGLNELDTGQFNTIDEVDAIVGCAIFARRDALLHIDLLDPSYFMYHEDIDWCCRARKAGYKVLYVPHGEVWHRDSQIRAADLPRITYYMTRNAYLLMSKQSTGFLIKARVVFQDLVWLTNWTLNPKWRHKREQRDALLKGLIDAVLKNYGKQEYRHGL